MVAAVFIVSAVLLLVFRRQVTEGGRAFDDALPDGLRDKKGDIERWNRVFIPFWSVCALVMSTALVVAILRNWNC